MTVRLLRLLLAVAFAACVRPSPDELTARLHAVSDAGRTLAQLDVSGDGKVASDDAEALARLAAAAAEKAGPLDVGTGFHLGVPANEAPVWQRLRVAADGPDLSTLTPARARELAIEARWMSLQARLVAASGGAISADAVGGFLRQKLPGYDPSTMNPAAVCAAMSSVKDLVRLYERAGLPPVAIFDVDSTIWAGNGTDVFLATIIERKLPRPEANLALQQFLGTVAGVDAKQVLANDVLANARILFDRSIDLGLPEAERVSSKDSFYNIVQLLRGVSIEDGRAAARQAIEIGAGPYPAWKSRVFADGDGCGMADVLARLANEGVAVYLLSATPEVLVQEAGRLFGIPAERALGSTLEVEAGRYTGRVRENTYYSKGPLTRQWLPAPPIVAFGDSPTSDFAMLLEATAAGFMVNPRPPFLERDTKEAGARLVQLEFDGTLAELREAQR
jgi:phosphoserine phosphatase